jgi:hypothetical protein
MVEIITKYIAAELALSEHLITDEMPLETLYRHVLAQEQGVEVQHVIDQVGSLGFRETDVIEIGLIMGVESFFDVDLPDDAMGTMRTVGAVQRSWSTRYRRSPTRRSRHRRSTICSRHCQARTVMERSIATCEQCHGGR